MRPPCVLRADREGVGGCFRTAIRARPRTTRHTTAQLPAAAASGGFPRAPGRDHTRGRHHGRRAALDRRGGRVVVAVDDAGADDEPGQKDLNWLSIDYGAPGATSLTVMGLGRHRHLGCQHPRCRFAVRHRRRRVRQLLALRDGGHRRLLRRSSIPARPTVAPIAAPAPRSWARSPRPRPWPSCRLGPLRRARLGRLRRGLRDGQHVSHQPRLLHAGHRRDGRTFADFGNPADAFLLNVCSYPSGSRELDPSDCVFAPTTASSRS